MSGDNVQRAVQANWDNLSEGAKEALVACAHAYPFGCNWGFLRPTDKDLKSTAEALKAESGRIRFNRLKNAMLIECDPSFLAQSVNAIVPNAVNTPFAQMAQTRKRDEMTKFTNYMKRFLGGKDSGASKNSDGSVETTVGLYCVNETNKIRLGGKDYNAFKLNIEEAVYAINTLAQSDPKIAPLYNSIMFKAVDTNTKSQVWIPVSSVGPNTVQGIYFGMELADSDTGIFLTIGVAPRK
jgi:hypothetical protein